MWNCCDYKIAKFPTTTLFGNLDRHCGGKLKGHGRTPFGDGIERGVAVSVAMGVAMGVVLGARYGGYKPLDFEK